MAYKVLPFTGLLEIGQFKNWVMEQFRLIELSESEQPLITVKTFTEIPTKLQTNAFYNFKNATETPGGQGDGLYFYDGTWNKITL